MSVTGLFFGFLPGFRGVLPGFFVTFRLRYKFFLGIETLRGPQELRQRAWDCPLLDFAGYRSFFGFLPGFRGVLLGFRYIPVML